MIKIFIFFKVPKNFLCCSLHFNKSNIYHEMTEDGENENEECCCSVHGCDSTGLCSRRSVSLYLLRTSLLGRTHRELACSSTEVSILLDCQQTINTLSLRDSFNDLTIGWQNLNLLSHPNATLAQQEVLKI